MLDLLIEGGHAVIPGEGIHDLSIGIQDGRVVMLGMTGSLPEAVRVVDATGRYVLPGLFDAHTHTGFRLPLAQECEMETRAALVGGITTLGIYVAAPGSYFDVFEDFKRTAEQTSFVDLVFHFRLSTEQQREEVPRYARELGVTSFKVYMWGIPDLIPAADDGFILDTMREVAALGPGHLIVVHAENKAIVDRAVEHLAREKPDGTLADWVHGHPAVAEEEAVIRASYLGQLAGARVHIAHLSSREAARRLPQLQAENPELFIESTSPLLSVSYHDDCGLLGKMVPPLRGPEDIDALWQALAARRIHTVGTDNTPKSRAVKAPEAGMWKAMSGYGVLGTHLPALLTEGYHRRGVPLETVVRAATRAPAELYGIYPRKGTIGVGSDADLAIVDLDLERVVRHQDLFSYSDYSIYEGRTLRGWPVMTIKNGQVAVEDRQVLVAPGSGRYLPRSLAAASAQL